MNQLDALEGTLNSIGVATKAWRAKRLYIQGQHKTISAYLALAEPTRETWPSLMDGVTLHVESKWRSHKSDLHAMGVKHAILKQLHAAGLLETPPPADWRSVKL